MKNDSEYNDHDQNWNWSDHNDHQQDDLQYNTKDCHDYLLIKYQNLFAKFSAPFKVLNDLLVDLNKAWYSPALNVIQTKAVSSIEFQAWNVWMICIAVISWNKCLWHQYNFSVYLCKSFHIFLIDIIQNFHSIRILQACFTVRNAELQHLELDQWWCVLLTLFLHLICLWLDHSNNMQQQSIHHSGSLGFFFLEFNIHQFSCCHSCMQDQTWPMNSSLYIQHWSDSDSWYWQPEPCLQ